MLGYDRLLFHERYIILMYFILLFLYFIFIPIHSTPLSLYNPPPPLVPFLYCSLVSVVVVMSVTFKQFRALFSCPSEKQNMKQTVTLKW